MSKTWIRKMKRKKTVAPYHGVTALFVIMIISAIGIRVHCSTNMAVKNHELKELSHRKEELKKDILSLTYKDSASSSLAMVEVKARELGFVELTEPIYAIDQGVSPQVASLR